jgi:uncharacterized membrane protein
MILSGALAIIVCLAATTASRADFRVCNEVGRSIQVVLGYDAGKKGWFSQGWWVIDTGQCADLLVGNLTNRYYYLYAESGEDVWHGGDDGDAARFCIDRKVFLLNRDRHGDADDESCKRFGLESRNFFVVDTGDDATWTQTFVGSAPSQPPPEGSPPPGSAPAPKGPPPKGSACERYPNLC